MVNYSHLDYLLKTIQKAMNLDELFNVNLNVVKRDLSCPDCIQHFLASSNSKFSMQTRLTLAKNQGYSNYKVNVFYCKTEPASNTIYELEFETATIDELYEQLEIADFFQETKLFAIVISKFNSPYVDDETSEIYVYATN